MTPDPNAKNRHGEYERWLHVFTLNDSSGPSIHQHFSVPWLWEELQPNIEAIEALWHLSRGLEQFGPQWAEFWFNYNALMQSREMRRSEARGPYGLILPRMQLSACAQVLVGWKRELRSQFFKGATFKGKSPPDQEFKRVFYERLDSMLFRQTNGDCDDETQRTDEVGGGPV